MVKVKIRDKIIGLLVFYFLVALIAIGSTLQVSRQLEGGAAAINDAGRERMRSYRIAYLLGQYVKVDQSIYSLTQLRSDIELEVSLFEATLHELDQGDPNRPLSLPKDSITTLKMVQLNRLWQAQMKPYIVSVLNGSNVSDKQVKLALYRPMLEEFVEEINELVTIVEHSNAKATTLLRFLQIALVSLAFLGTVLLVYLFSRMVVQPVMQLHDGIKRMATADFDVRLPVTSQDEFGELANGFNSMADELKNIYSTLERRVEEKTNSIAAKNLKLAALDKEMAVSEERNLLAQELHDSIAQSLAFLNIQVQMLEDDIQSNRYEEALESLAQIREGVQESYDDVRELLVHFRTRIGETDLKTAISSALEKFEEQTGIKTKLLTQDSAPDLQPEQVLQVMHIVQESLSNVRKHAKASSVEVTMHKNGNYRVDIRDNGVGFDKSIDAGDTHVGMRIMRERARRIGAELSFDSTPGKGVNISIVLAKRTKERQVV